MFVRRLFLRTEPAWLILILVSQYILNRFGTGKAKVICHSTEKRSCLLLGKIHSFNTTLSEGRNSFFELTGEVLLLLLILDGRFGAGLINPTTGTPLYPEFPAILALYLATQWIPAC